MHNTLLLQQFDLLATAPGGVARLRELILALAVQGKLVPQNPADEPASALLKRIRAEKDQLIAEGKIKRDKPLAPIGEGEQPFGLPVGWEWVRIPEITYGLGQGEPKTSFSYIDVAAIDNAKGRITQEFQILEAADAPSRARKNVMQGTVIYSTVRPYLKNIAVVEQEYQPHAIASTAFAVMHPHTGVLSQYLLHYLRSQPFMEFVNSKAVGVAYPAINDANFFQGVVPLPPLPEQARIVARVEELMRVCDALEATGQRQAAHHRQLVQTLLGDLTADSRTPWQRVAAHFDTLLDRPSAVDALEQTILQLAVRGQLVPQDPADEPASALLQRIRAEKDRLIAEGKIKRDKPLAPIGEDGQPFELPPGWEWVRLGDVLDGGSGTTPLRARTDFFADGTEMWVKTTDLTNGIVTTCEELITKAAVIENRLKYFPAGTVCVAMYGGAGTIGKSGVLGVSSTINQSVFALPPTEGIDVGFLHTYVITVRSQWMSFAAGLRKDPNINGQIIKKMVMPLPPLPEQARIVARVAQLRRLCADLRQRLTQSQTTQAALAEALVAQLP